MKNQIFKWQYFKNHPILGEKLLHDFMEFDKLYLLSCHYNDVYYQLKWAC